MKHEFEMVVTKLPRNLDHINLYPIGDLHIGSPEFNIEMWEKWKKMVMNDPKGYVVIIGDMLDNGLKTSKTNSYYATIPPHEQKQWLVSELRPLKEKILGACCGNHEERTTIATGDSPLYDVMAKLDIEDLYRHNGAILKISLGEKRSDRQFTYVVTLGHGGSRAKVDKFHRSIDGVDVMISGHTHQASVDFPSKLIIDPRNDVVTTKTYINMVVPSFLHYGGYGMQALYSPSSLEVFPSIKLHGTKKKMEVRIEC